MRLARLLIDGKMETRVFSQQDSEALLDMLLFTETVRFDTREEDWWWDGDGSEL
jgi:hypothetical protein